MRLVLTICLALCAAPALAETLVATRTIRAQTLITPEDVVHAAIETPGALREAALVIGQEARVALYAGRPIRPGDIGPAAVVERNQIVLLVFDRGGLRITAEGRALGRGAPGEAIRVMNLSSRSTVGGTISADGSVHVSSGPSVGLR